MTIFTLFRVEPSAIRKKGKAMIIEALIIGLIIGFLFYELVGISPGGVIAPAYFALYINQPSKIFVTVIIAFIVFAIIIQMNKVSQ